MDKMGYDDMKINMEPSGVSLHFEKHKGNDTAVNGLQRHNERVPGQKHSNKNINDERTQDNVFLKQSTEKYNKAIQATIERNRKNGLKGVRKDAVRMVEGTVQLSGKILDASEDVQEQVLKDAYNWVKTTYGEDNVISAVIHKDETNMHLHFDFVPIDSEGKLTAKTIVSRSALHRYQDGFLRHLQTTHPAENFQRGGGNYNGLRQRDYEKVQAERAEKQAKLDQREIELDAREDNLDDRETALDAKTEQLRKKEESVLHTSAVVKTASEHLKQRQATYMHNVRDYNKSVNELKNYDKTLHGQKNALDKRERKLDAVEAEINKKGQKASQRLSDALRLMDKAKEAQQQNEHEKTRLEKLRRDIERIKSQLSKTWEKVTNMVRHGELKPDKVTPVLDRYKPVTVDNAPDLTLDLDDLVDNHDDKQL